MAALVAVPLLWNCGGNKQDPDPVKPETVTLSLADASATAETRALYANLWSIREKGWMFGHHDDLMYGRKWYGTEGGSDTKDVCGDYPGVYALDLASLMDQRSTDASEQAENEMRIKLMKQAYNRGMVITACNMTIISSSPWMKSFPTAIPPASACTTAALTASTGTVC